MGSDMVQSHGRRLTSNRSIKRPISSVLLEISRIFATLRRFERK